MRTAKDIMTTDVVTIDADATVTEALDRIRNVGIRCLIVEKRTTDGSYGIVTQRDMTYKVLAESLDPATMRVHTVMTRPLVSISGDMGVQDVARLMKLTGLSRLPVIEKGMLQGIVSVSDIVAAA